MIPVEEYCLELPKHIQPILKKLRLLILSTTPNLEERIIYGIPFFYLKKRIFYLNPTKYGIDLGFCEGYLLSEHPIVDIKNRSKVRTISYNSPKQIDEEILIPILHEAILNH